jgi:hypothetical protein
LVQLPRQHHEKGARVRCQYIEIDQVRETSRLIGSRPFWLWGFEHGLNEHGVAIGNHTVFARDELGTEGLIGMDLVRLGLERGRSAREAVEVIAALPEVHGQGGSGPDKSWPYHNSFLRRCGRSLPAGNLDRAPPRNVEDARSQPHLHRRRLGCAGPGQSSTPSRLVE